MLKLEEMSARKNFFYLMFILIFVPVDSRAQADSIIRDSLASGINALIKNRLPAGSNVGIAIYDLEANASLYSYQADKLSRPASTMKLLTAITSLDQADGSKPFRTEVRYSGTINQDTLKGDIYVIGGYDPEFNDKALNGLVDQMLRFPFSVVTGKIYGDVSMKDSLYWGSGWAWDDTPESYQPYLSPLMLNKGVLTVSAFPQGKGEAAQLKCVPSSSYYTITNNTFSYTPSAGCFRVTRDWLHNRNEVIVSGNIEFGVVGEVNLYSSQDFFMRTLLDRLEEKGVRCLEGYDFRALSIDSPSKLMGKIDTPIQKVLNQLMKESDNLNAQALLCRLGAQVTGKKQISDREALEATKAMISKLGYDPAQYNLADGCGLSNYNYISPELLVCFLKYAYSHTDIFRRLYKALPIGGVDGTLKNRMKRGSSSYKRVHAKTGSFTAINCLAGYLKADNGHKIAFAIMNQNALSASQARNFQDAVCDKIIDTLK
jgi:D-alanyl-D-alanine carboxypeptidase, serine-type, PBP4 family